MYADYSRDTFRPTRHFRRVLMQQGRVQIDADFNEQVAILLHYMEAMAADLFGPHGGPKDNCGFEVIGDPSILDSSPHTNHWRLSEAKRKELKEKLLKRDTLLIAPGHYYIDGILCENDTYLLYDEQPDYPGATIPADGEHLVYLDAWERHISHIEDKALDAGNVPGIREVALGGPDTASRSRMVWQVKLLPVSWSKDVSQVQKSKLPDSETHDKDIKDLSAVDLHMLIDGTTPSDTPRLAARTNSTAAAEDDICLAGPGAPYHGAENQLYRVEIHNDSQARNSCFKWSRENGSVVFPIRSIAGQTVTLGSFGADSRLDLREDDWVELLDDEVVYSGKRNRLCKVVTIDRDRLQLTLDRDAPLSVGHDLGKHPLLRRWDHGEQADEKSGCVPLPAGVNVWLPLEHGVQIQFEPGKTYRSGDYWLIPARTVASAGNGDVEWPLDRNGAPELVPPHGIAHHYAPLALINLSLPLGEPIKPISCRNEGM